MPEKKYHIFGKGGGSDIAIESGVSLLGEVPLNMAMRDANDGGMPVVLTKEENPAKEAIRLIAEKMTSEVRRLNLQSKQAGALEINI
jgi:ATP-binding protein involved in chromosome partitioning